MASRIADEVSIPLPGTAETLSATFLRPARSCGIVLFAHGSGSGRFSVRNRMVADRLVAAGFSALLAGLLTDTEEAIDAMTSEYRFDVALLAKRLDAATAYVRTLLDAGDEAVGYFGASTGAAAALIAAADPRNAVRAVVSRGGRPDLAGDALALVKAPTLLIVGGEDRAVIELNRAARAMMRASSELALVPGATHLFEESGALETVAELAAAWFERHLV
jgi:putative phosphoribosyl transferase